MDTLLLQTIIISLHDDALFTLSSFIFFAQIDVIDWSSINLVHLDVRI